MTNRTISGLSRGGELMDLVQERTNVILEEEDRISNLPHDIFHHILCFLDMKYAVQTCTLSKKWKHLWSSMPNINLNSSTFPTSPQFSEFVKHALSHRNNHTEVSAVDLTYKGIPASSVVESIVNYAYLHNVKKLNIRLFTHKISMLPQQIFSSHTLKHLSLVANPRYSHSYIIGNVAWDFPVLETLNMKNVLLCKVNDKDLNLFSKCVNLKKLTLHGCSAYGIFNICAPQLSTLTIAGDIVYAKVFNVVAPHLQYLTLTVTTSGFNFLEISTEGLKKVYLSLSGLSFASEMYMWGLLDLFPKLRSAKYLIFEWGIIEFLSSYLDQLPHEPCHFEDLKCLRINLKHKQRMPTQVKNYFLGNSPNATFIMDLPQVQQKRSLKSVQMQDGVVAKQKEKGQNT